MKVRVQYNTTERIINIPVWQESLFWHDPENFLAPLFDQGEHEIEWEILPG